MNPTPAELAAFFAAVRAVNASTPPTPEPFTPTPHGGNPQHRARVLGLTAAGQAWRRRGGAA